MDITLRETENSFIFDVKEKNITPKHLARLESFIKKASKHKPCALNLGAVEKICWEFFEFLKRLEVYKLALINLPTNIFLILNLTSHDKLTRIFLTEYDFLQEKRMIINRKFSLIQLQQ